jgi:hypothetical protein
MEGSEGMQDFLKAVDLIIGDLDDRHQLNPAFPLAKRSIAGG